jgi:CBS domain-containing protein
MKRWLYTYRTLQAPAADVERTLLEHSTDLIQLAVAAPDEPPGVDGSFVAELEGAVAWFDAGKRVRISTGVAHRPRDRAVLPLDWHAEPLSEVFPKFSGALEVAALDEQYCQLTLSGSYNVPFGPLGWGADRAVMRKVAQSTAEQLVSGIAREIRRMLAAESTPAPPSAAAAPPTAQLQVRHVMSADPLVLEEAMSVRDAAQLLFSTGISGAPVVAADGALLGVLSEHDLLAKEAAARFGVGRDAREEQRRREARTAGEACTRPAQVTVPQAPLAEAARLMLDGGVKRLVVVDKGRVAGMISRHDVLAALVRSDAELATAVQELIDDLGHTEVRAEVRGGQVELAGATLIRSDAARLVDAVARIDGVTEVHSALTWLTDDTRSTVPVPFS